MKCLHLGQLLILLTVSLNVQASEIKQNLKIAVEELNQVNCPEVMRTLELSLERLHVSDYQKEIQEEGHEGLLHDLWINKLNIHERLKSFNLGSGLTEECALSSRRALRAIRTSEDYVSEHQFRNNGSTMKFPDNAFEEGNIHVRRHPEHPRFNLKKDLKSGDILLTRGNAFTSAAIANLGDFDTQFSHMSIVYRDENNKAWTVEAHIEVGSFVRPLEDHIKDKNFRTMVFRYDDSEFAARAAKYIFNKVKKASDSTGNILYDFGFDQDDSEKLFCSEVVSHAFDHISGSTVKIPMFRSHLLVRKPEFVKMLGIESATSFIPADIEIDPRFKVIAEWRDANRLNDNLQKDAIIQAMFKWNDDYGYQMRQGSSHKAFIYRNVAWPLRRVPFLKKYFVDKLPVNMSRELIGYFGVLESIGELLQKELKVSDERSLKERGLPLMKSEKYDILDEVRLKDLASKKKKLHKMYRPLKQKD